ncbi:sigma-54-dependent Fis family transcriptional regulator [Thalassotalea litorea]|uniref:Sigma-54-dependent Fis family transcriptional regulator n=1 Tax=Thalassotalea litorea TaxID=2020715 RepID=A0A5R9IM82_9GAMM|nr:sigma-54 dependent transcriptional regulator [Thalassotalea litorea]TLU65157.1 sigma-54-dependent Fis family transcriptional regulator [Thalassotalea litorea]
MSSKKSEETKKRSVLVIGSIKFFTEINVRLSAWHCVNCPIHDVEKSFSLIGEHAIKVIILIFEQPSHQLLFASLDRLHHRFPELKWITILQESQLQKSNASLLLPDFIYDYHHFPIDFDRLNHTLGHAHGLASISKAKSDKKYNDSPIEDMLGSSEAIQCFKQQLKLVANTNANANANILITGETGTGKDLAAIIIHKLSSRNKAPFVHINCAAFPEHLIQSELFGHEKGAFTGAEGQHIGKIEQAQGGTLFLNEIGDLPAHMQVILLKFLDDKMLERIGANEQIRIDCRIIAATHEPLEQAVEHGKFREDLFHRLNILRLHSPPLRDRSDDVLLLAKSKLSELLNDRSGAQLADELALKILNYHWPGNVRELFNFIERLVVMGGAENSNNEQVFDILEPVKSASNLETANMEARKIKRPRELKKQEIIEAIESSDYNLSKAAKLLSISRTSLYRLIHKSNLDISKE